MASIFKTPKSVYWHCSFKNSDGKYIQVSTRLTDEGKAQLFCDGLQTVANDYREKVRSVAYLKKMLNSIAALVGGETIEDYTFRTWSDSWLADQEAANADGTYKRYRQLFDEFKEYLGKKADAPLSELSVESIRGFRDQQIAAGITNAAANVLLKAIRGCLNLAMTQGYLEYNRAMAVKILGKASTIKKPFARGQVEILLALATGEWRGLILAGYFIGARIGALAKIMREQVNYETGILTYTPNKQRRTEVAKTVTIPVHQQFLDYLAESGGRTGPMFPELKKITVSKLSKAFRELLNSSDIQCAVKEGKGEKGRDVFELSFHSLRKAFNSDLANSNVSQEIRQKLIGHASKEVNDMYTVLEVQTFRAAIATLSPLKVTAPPANAVPLVNRPPKRRARRRKGKSKN